MLDLRLLLTKYRIEWRDRGANVGKNHINIHCVLCGNSDRGFHLSINEKSFQYYCFRNPRHAGNSVEYILRVLKIPQNEYSSLKPSEGIKDVIIDGRDYSAWHTFEPAEESDEMLSYLESRLFLNPVAIAQSCDLRYSKQGEWAGRLIIPLYTKGWTGRSIRSHLTLRYKAYCNEDSFFFYSNKSTSCIITEGAIDAMKILASSVQFDVIAKCRITLSSAILAHLREQQYESIYNCPDGTVPYSQYRQETAKIRNYCPVAKVEKFLLPAGLKDFGAATESDTRRLLLAI